MAHYKHLAIVGVGMIGASIGLAARRRGLADEVIGVGRDPDGLDRAKQLGAIDRGSTDLATGVVDVDLVVICTPVDTIAPLAEQVAAACGATALITDAGSSKAEIAERLARSLPTEARFVGSHPLAGSDKTGCEAGEAELFVDRPAVVTPLPNTPDADTEAICEFWQALGSQVHRMSPAEHDEAVAATSHLPHLVASAIAASTPEEYLALVSSGWLDTTRVAAGDADLWRQIFLSNRPPVLAALARLSETLDTFRSSLEEADDAELTSLLEQAKRTRDALGS